MTVFRMNNLSVNVVQSQLLLIQEWDFSIQLKRKPATEACIVFWPYVEKLPYFLSTPCLPQGIFRFFVTYTLYSGNGLCSHTRFTVFSLFHCFFLNVHTLVCSLYCRQVYCCFACKLRALLSGRSDTAFQSPPEFFNTHPIKMDF